jgi:hypothetical protein
MITKRDDIGSLMTKLNYTTAAEIGVQNGLFSKIILSTWDGHLTLVDAWQKLDNYTDIANVSDQQHNMAYENTINNTSNFSSRCKIIKGISPDISSSFVDEEFDLVYLDANHSYEAVLQDISFWIKKVKKTGGCICGHDYLDGKLSAGDFGVKSAVHDFFKKDPDIVTNEHWPSWFIFI